MNEFFQNKGICLSGILNLSPKESYELSQKGAIIVDVREEYMNRFKIFDVKEVIFCPKSILLDTYLDLPKNKPLIFADSVGLRSKEVVILMKEKGYNYIANMAGGIVDWEREGLPIRVDYSEQLTGSCMCQLKKRKKK